MIVHVVDGTYELFRHFYGARRFNKGKDRPYGAVVGVLQTLLQMIEQGATLDRVVQMDRRSNKIRNAAGVREKFGVDPPLIPDFLALVGDAADGYPGIPGIGAISAAKLLNQYGTIESFPPAVLGERRDLAILFKNLATLRTDAPLFGNVDELRWTGPTDAFDACSQRMETPRLLERAIKAKTALQAQA